MLNLLNPWALIIGGLALLGPLWAHWIQRTRPKIAPFGSFQWMPPPATLQKRRNNLRYWPLLLLRMALVILAAMAFAKPQWLSVAGLESRERETTVWIVDRSFSMKASTEDESSSWEEVKAALQDRLNQLNEVSDLRIILTPALSEWPEDFLKPEEWRGLIGDVEPVYFGESNGLSRSIRKAGLILNDIQSEWPRRVAVFSDFQNTALEDLDQVRLSETIAIECVKVGPNEAINHSPSRYIYSISGNDIAGRSPLDPPVTQARYKVSPVTQGIVEVADSPVDGPDSEPRALNINEIGGWIDLDDLAAETGIWRRAVTWPESDALMDDNTFYDFYEAPVPVPFIMIEPQMTGPVFERELFFVAKALDPYSSLGTSDQQWSYYRTQYAHLDEWKSKLDDATSIKSEKQFIVAPDLNAVEWNRTQSDFWNAISSGATAWVFLGAQYQPETYQQIFSRLNGLQFGAVRSNTSSAPLEAVSRSHPLWGDWDSSIRRWLRRIPIYQYAEISEENAENVVARLEDGTPFIVHRNHGSGNIVFWNTSADREWTDWQTSGALFAPTIIRMAQWRHRTQYVNDPLMQVSPSSIPIVRGWISADPALQLPSGSEEREVRIGDLTGTLRLSGLWTPDDSNVDQQPGWSSAVEVATGKQIAWVAWNSLPQESILDSTSAIVIQRQLESQRQELSDTEKVSEALSTDRQESSLWKWLLLTALIAWNLEIVIANRTQPTRHAA